MDSDYLLFTFLVHTEYSEQFCLAVDAHGMNGFLSKPIIVSKLNQELERWIPSDKKLHADSAIQDYSQAIFEIEGLDTSFGLDMARNSIPIYLDLLDSYCKDSVMLSEKMRESLAENDLSRFTMYVHSLKSSSAAIGAAKISEQAAAFERAGNNKNRSKIDIGFDDFMSDLDGLTERILEATKKNLILKEKRGDTQSLFERLQEIEKALDTFELSLADQLVDGLKQYAWTSEITSLLSDLSDNIIISEIDKAHQCLIQLSRLAEDEG